MKNHNKTFFSSTHFITLIAAMMGLTALGIDAVLPAFSALTTDFHLPPERANDIQLVIFAYMLGFASMQLIFGVLSDAFGRKIILCIGISIYILASAWAIFIDHFALLLLARFLQGLGLAAPRVLSLAVVRDVTSGRAMAKIMSYTMMIFMTVPILAPFVGQLALKMGHWHNIFFLFILFGSVVMIWIMTTLPETLPPEKRTPLSWKATRSALLTCLKHKPTMIYLLILGMVFSMTMCYIGQAEQIFQRDIYALGDKFPVVFALCCMGIVAASYTNSQLVMRLGMHKIIMISLRCMLVNGLILLGITFYFAGKPPLLIFLPMLIIHFFYQGLLMPNINSLTLEPHRQIAGVASALVSSAMTIIGVVVGGFIAGQFNNTLYPLTLGYTVLTLAILLLNRYVNRITTGL